METGSVDDASLIQKLEFEAGTTSGNGGFLSDREYKQARTLISDTEKVVISLDQEIPRLIAKREEVAERLSRFRFATAPYKRLPVEVLSDIFVWTLDGQPVVFPPVDCSDAPWVLRQICSSWRHVALNEPRLWNDVRITIPAAHPRLPLMVNFLHSIISPTGPLSIFLKRNIDTTPERVVDDLIIPHIPRIKNLNLHITFGAFGRLLEIRHQDFSELETLHLSIYSRTDMFGRGSRMDWSTMSEKCRRATVFQSAHLLRHLTIFPDRNDRSTNNMLHIPFPWAGLTTLHIINIRPLTPSDLRHLLPKCTSLIELEAELYYGSSVLQPGETDNTIVLPHLRRLRINGINQAPHSLPSLQLPWDQLIRLDLIDLDVDHTFFEMHAILSHCIRVEELRIDSFPGIDPPSSTPLPLIVLPRLKVLRIWIDDPLTLDCFVVPAMEVLYVDSPVTLAESNISDVIIRSSCSLSSFTYRCHPESVDPQDIHYLLTFMPLLHNFQVGNTVIDQEVIRGIASGELLPRLGDLSCLMEKPFLVPFVKVLEMCRTPTGMSDGAGSTILRQLWDVSVHRAGQYTDGDVHNAFERLRDLDEENGTSFNVMLSTSPLMGRTMSR
ncbi:hypothetical protein FPV67DRAFT_1518873 [Lyophyllum atratum]|nr:hypothetical protein FPV67DRAFT_1518873 [Lyophyllum atratum]